MQRALRSILLVLCLALAAGALQAQAPAPAKPPVYVYVAEWAVPRAQWPDMQKVDAGDKSICEKLMADGTIIGYGSYTNLIHQEGEPTHGSWFTATSEGNLLKALDAFYAHPGSTDAAVQAASKHWDQILTGDMYNAKSGSSGGYLIWSKWVVKPGMMRAYAELTKKIVAPVLDKLVADGTVTSWGELSEDYHTEKLGTVYDYFTVPDTASLDKLNKAFDDLFGDNGALLPAYQALTERDGHRDYLTRLNYMASK